MNVFPNPRISPKDTQSLAFFTLKFPSFPYQYSLSWSHLKKKKMKNKDLYSTQTLKTSEHDLLESCPDLELVHNIKLNLNQNQAKTSNYFSYRTKISDKPSTSVLSYFSTWCKMKSNGFGVKTERILLRRVTRFD